MSKEATIIQSFNDLKRQYEYFVKGYDVTESVKILLKRHKEEYDKEKNIFAGIDGYLEAQKEYQSQIADLEAKLTENEKERELDNSFWKQECDSLQKALAEKTLTIEQINKAFIENRSLWKGKYERANQYKISFAVEQLEKVKEKLLDEIENVTELLDPLEYEDYHEFIGCGRGYKNSVEEIDNKIKQLKEGK